jgi:hypothetical protein
MIRTIFVAAAAMFKQSPSHRGLVPRVPVLECMRRLAKQLELSG